MEGAWLSPHVKTPVFFHSRLPAESRLEEKEEEGAQHSHCYSSNHGRGKQNSKGTLSADEQLGLLFPFDLGL